MAEIRTYRPEDLDALYRICLETGDAGKDATALYRDPKLIGHVYAAPYAVLSPETVFVAADDAGVGGYIVGPVDTRSFERRMEAEWWPPLRRQLADPVETPPRDWSRDDRMRYLIHHPVKTPDRIARTHPSHLHINLLPRLQGRGYGAKLIDTWLAAMRERGSRGAHLGVGAANERAVRFYRRYGFRELARIGPPANVIWFGTELP
jgi:ribosomal protein S18 acetylase RimI-like enzyme